MYSKQLPPLDFQDTDIDLLENTNWMMGSKLIKKSTLKPDAIGWLLLHSTEFCFLKIICDFCPETFVLFYYYINIRYIDQRLKWKRNVKRRGKLSCLKISTQMYHPILSVGYRDMSALVTVRKKIGEIKKQESERVHKAQAMCPVNNCKLNIFDCVLFISISLLP